MRLSPLLRKGSHHPVGETPPPLLWQEGSFCGPGGKNQMVIRSRTEKLKAFYHPVTENQTTPPKKRAPLLETGGEL